VVGDLAVADAHHVDSLEVNFAVSWSDAEEISFMCSVVCLVRGHPVAIDDLPMDLCVKVGEGGTHIAVQLAHARFVGASCLAGGFGRRNRSPKTVRKHRIAFSLNIFGIPENHSFRGIGCGHRTHFFV